MTTWFANLLRIVPLRAYHGSALGIARFKARRIMTHRATASLAVIALAAMWSFPAMADVHPNALFSDHAVLQRDMKVPVWGAADKDEKVTVTVNDQTVSTVAKDGTWMVWLDPMPAGGPYQMTIEGKNRLTFEDVLIGEVWLCSGQSNMAMSVARSADAESTIASSANSMIRLATIPRQAHDEPRQDVQTEWKTCGPQTVGDFSAVGYFFGRHLQDKLDVPIGLINSSYGGTPAEAWTAHEKLESNPKLQPILSRFDQVVKLYPAAEARYQKALDQWKVAAKKARQEGKDPPRRPRPPQGPENPRRPSGLYNAMIHPLQPYALRGAIWYQGESNAPRAHEYHTLLPAMIGNWRDDWAQGNFPFLIVQLAPFRQKTDAPAESDWAELREAQRQTTLTVPNTAQAVITDVGDETDIHPKQKAPVGDRLALAARHLAYGEDIEFAGPRYESMKVTDQGVELQFSHLGGGLEARGGPLTGFTVAGEDRKFFKAQAEIQGEKIVVHCPQVDKPVAVRYGWANFPRGNLWNRAGLPASPFRTDSFPMITRPK
jgi:sialate O-acetylesterase